MRDLLTVLAGLVILVLAALLAVPPLVDWQAHRPWVEAALARALGQPVHTEGRLALRLLPMPRLRAERMRLGSGRADAPLVDAMYVRAEMALTPLLAGEVKLRSVRVGRAEIRLPTGAGGDWRVPQRLVDAIVARRGWSVDELRVQQFLVTTLEPATGRTDQAYADDVRLEAGSLAGPGRLEGRLGSVPFDISYGEISTGQRTSLKIGAGGRGRPRVDVDGQLELVPDGEHEYEPRVVGTARLVAGAETQAGRRPALQAQAQVVASGGTIDLPSATIEAGEGAGAIRLAGAGAYRLDPGRLRLDLTGRRLDLAAAVGAWPDDLSAPDGMSAGLDLKIALDSVAIPGGDLTEAHANLAIDGGRVRVEDAGAKGPGQSSLRLAGRLDLARRPAGQASVGLTAARGEALAPMLAANGLGSAAVALDSRPLDLAGDVTLADRVASVRNLRLALGDATATGTVRYTWPDEAADRPRLDAQVALRNVDLDRLGDGTGLLAAARGLDLGLTLDARGVRAEGRGDGRISGRLEQDGDALRIEGLDIRNLAGAEASLAGRLEQDGTGRITGRLKAPRAAPLLDLLGPAWLGDADRFVPTAMRDGAVDLAVAIDREAAATSSLRTRLDGKVAGGPFTASTVTIGGALQDVAVVATTDDVGNWFGARPGPSLQNAAGRIELKGRRGPDGALLLSLSGAGAGLSLSTAEPISVPDGRDWPVAGAVDLQTDDAAGLLPLLTGLPAAGPLPARLRVAPSGAGRLSVSGQIAGASVRAAFGLDDTRTLTGEVSASRMSLPALASALALGPLPPASGWSSTRFAPSAGHRLAASISVAADSLTLASTLVARNARFGLAATPTGLAIRNLEATLGDGSIKGSVGIERQGGLASLIGEGAIDAPLGLLLAAPLDRGRLGATLQFGASGESPAGLVANLGGAGSVTLRDLSVAGADAGAASRVAARVARSDDPLASTKWTPLLAAELDKAALGVDRAGASASLVAGTLRVTPLDLKSPAGTWTGSASFDARAMTLDIKGVLRAADAPARWTADERPAIGLGWTGPVARPVRTIDPAPLVNALATVVLKRELDRIETFDLDAAERARLNGRQDMDRQRLQLIEAARQAKAREEQERRDADRRAADPPPPLDIRTPAQAGATGG